MPRDLSCIPHPDTSLAALTMANRKSILRRLKPRIRRRSKPGARPGTITPQPGALPTVIRVMAYDKDRIIEETIDNPRDLQQLMGKWPVVWVDVVGLGSEDKLREIGTIFHIHPLALEDVVHIFQRAKVDTYDENLYIVLRIPDPSNEQLTEQFSLFLGKNYLVTFQERPGDCFDLIRAGLRYEQSASRQALRPGYLAYRLIDASIDAYFPVLEALGDHLDQLDDLGTNAQTNVAFAELHAVRRELLMLRRAIWPLRDAISELRSEVTPYVSDEMRIYLRDCYDHAVQLIDLLESYRDIAGDVRDYYLSTVSNRMSQVMKTLTVISTIFLPLSFIAGVYGMNFKTEVSPWNMPELSWRYGYPFAWGVMITVAAGMLLNFKQRGWLSSGPKDEPPETITATPKRESNGGEGERGRQGDTEAKNQGE
jgi:magnesium transporter